MQKMVILLILATFIVNYFNISKVIKLRKEIKNLQSELPQLKKQASETYFTVQDLQSNYYGEYNRIATCNDATEQELLTVAKQCTKITNQYWAITIVDNLCKNPATTGKVIKELLNSPYCSIWNIAAKSMYADEAALIAIAKQCTKIQNAEDWVTSIATNLCRNPAATGKVIKELSNVASYPVWNIAAQSMYADEEALIAIAKQCNTISSYDETSAKTIATSICKNPAITDNVFKELEKSDFNSVVIIAVHAKVKK